MDAQPTALTSPKSPRLWPGVLAVVLQWLTWLVIPYFFPAIASFGIIGGVAGGAVILIWWLFFSRVPWPERLGVIALVVVALVATRRIVDESIVNGMMGNALFVLSIPVMSLALVLCAAAARRFSGGLRRMAMVATILAACSVFTLIRTGGIDGDANSDLHWRWTQSPEERLLASADDLPIPAPETPSAPPSEPAAPADPPAEAAVAAPAPEPTPLATVKAKAKWPGFRGPLRDSAVHGVRIDTDWSSNPPVELWRRPIGPGWSSFAVQGDLIYTQEQRGDEEIVSCYNLTTGKPVWGHRDAARFWESNGGAGPRGTPTLSNGRVYTFGGTGIVNALDARSGAVVWSHNAAKDTGAETPGWGFSSSPLVVNDVVIVAASGRLIAYDAADGHERWRGPANGAGYSSPHLATIDGVDQVLLLRGARTTSVAPADGAVLWEYTMDPAVSIVQPAITSDGDVLIAAGDMMGGTGIRRITIAHESGKWATKERWSSSGLKPYFNDFIVHEGYAYGFDGNILACIDLADGTRKWKGGRYGNGQIVLLADQGLLLVSSEEGELALVSATPDKFTEIARVPAIEGKTWNHPVLVGNILLVRNGEEMAAFRLATSEAP
jgi:outer membrane protein assembly factor BamB